MYSASRVFDNTKLPLPLDRWKIRACPCFWDESNIVDVFRTWWGENRMLKTCPYVRDELKIRFRIFAIFRSVWEKSKIRNYPFLRLGRIEDSKLSLSTFKTPGKIWGGGGGRCGSRGRSTNPSLYQTRSSLELKLCCLLNIVEALGRGACRMLYLFTWACQRKRHG